MACMISHEPQANPLIRQLLPHHPIHVGPDRPSNDVDQQLPKSLLVILEHPFRGIMRLLYQMQNEGDWTVKDLAKNCGYGCVVFNCSDQLDYIVMGKFLKGLVGTGFWGCFDEFNRVNVEVMSVVEAVVKSILRRFEQLAGAVGPIFIIDSEIFAQPTMHMCITMNPGYAGRSKLPESLEILFRSVTMLVPDITFIVEIQLACEGILNSRSLAKKLAMLCRCCESLLSKQPHYDYGLRFVKSCIKTIGSAKRAQGIPLQECAPAVKTHEKVELLKRCHVLVSNRSF